MIVDGAAFGSEMRDVYTYLETENHIVLYAPESFEWMLFSSAVVPNVRMETVLNKPENYIDSKEYVSWESFFTKLLITSTQDSPVWSYSKRKLPKVYLSPRVLHTVKKAMKLIRWELP